MVIYGTIWYQGKTTECGHFRILSFILIYIGEGNAGNPSYACKFASMIEYWRQIWNQRTNGSTDIQFPFGFVQVSFILTRS